MASTEHNIRRYDATRDRDAVMRIFRECGWIGDSEAEAESIDSVVDGSEHCWVATINGEAEVFVLGAQAELQHGGHRLAVGLIAAVVTSLVARRQGLATRLTAHVNQELRAAGALMTTLGIFDHGYYDKLGFGQGPSDNFVWLDPERLRVPIPARPPVRLTVDDSAEIHASRWRRLRHHGSISVRGEGHTRESVQSSPNGVGFGYRDDAGVLTHYAWFRRPDAEVGPWLMQHYSFQTWPQFVELLGLVKSFSDQVRLVRICEPPGIQLQSMLERPFRHLGKTKGSALAERINAMVWSQYRVNDLPATTAALASHVDVKFRLALTDPIAAFLPPEASWAGVGGDYDVTLSRVGSSAQRVVSGPDQESKDAGVATLNATVNQWTAWWLGVCPASVLNAQGGFEAAPELLAQLDVALRLPRPAPDWDY